MSKTNSEGKTKVAHKLISDKNYSKKAEYILNNWKTYRDSILFFKIAKYINRY